MLISASPMGIAGRGQNLGWTPRLGAHILQSPGGIFSWNAEVINLTDHVISSEKYSAPVQITFRPLTNFDLVVGLNTDGVLSGPWQDIDAAGYCEQSGNATRTLLSGTAAVTGVTFAINDIFQVIANGTTLNFLKNGSSIANPAFVPIGPLGLDMTAGDPDTAVHIISFGPY